MPPEVQRNTRAHSPQLAEQFCAAWARSDEIFAIVRDRSMLSRPIQWRHPLIFYLGHLPAFAWNHLCRAILNWKSANPYFDEVFSRGIDPDVDDGSCHAHPEVPQQWPPVREVVRYRDRVRRAVLESLEAALPCGEGNVMAENGRVYRMVLEHEYMHQETLLYMVQQMPPGEKKRLRRIPDYRFGFEPGDAEIDVPGGRVRLGADFDDLEFGWDNEFPATEIEVERFTADAYPVTNGRFFEFLEAGGYDNRAFWAEGDWNWKQASGTSCPVFWLKRGSEWFYRGLFDLLPLRQCASWPVFVSLAEARAYARWRRKRLLSEAEFQRAATVGASAWRRNAIETEGNFDFRNWSPIPVDAGRGSAGGLKDLIGNGWEWTETPFAALPGFSPYIPTYPEYSADFFDGKHYVLKGASWATDARLVRPSFRNWYQAHYPYVFAKFRCVSE